MFLVLEVSSANAAQLGAASRAVFSVKGGAIGRRAGNDWVLADPHVSGRHARVRSVGGTFFLEDAESANGVLVNGTKLHPGEPFPLKEGDSIFIDPFEIVVRISTTMPDAVTQAQHFSAPISHEAYPPPQPPAAAEAGLEFPSLEDLYGSPQSTPGPSVSQPPPASGLVDLLGTESGGMPPEFNPLLDAPPPRAATPSPPTGRDLHGKPVINDAIDIRMPPLPVPATAPGRVSIPSNWDPSELLAPAEPRSAAADFAPAEASAPARESLPAAAVLRPGAGPSASSSDLEMLLRGAGLPEGSLSPETMLQLGQVLRVVVDGLMEVLRARGEIKSEFRLQQTTFKPRENNPLKFSANVEDALHNLLVKRNPAYLDAPAAFEDAFADVRAHQMAMLAGMRAAFDHMLGRFSPEALRAQFDAKPGRKAALGFGAAGRYWESFVEFHKEISADDDDCFRRLFGDQFARSYEEQLKQMQALKRHSEPRS